jgi:hypothetical protein
LPLPVTVAPPTMVPPIETPNFAPEPAQQAMWLVTPEHKVTWSAPVFCSDRTKEGW